MISKPTIETYSDKLLKNKKFKEVFEKEYSKLCISEEIAKTRHEAHLTQAQLAKKIHSTKSAISRYESGKYDRYSIPLLRRIASACGVELQVTFASKK